MSNKRSNYQFRQGLQFNAEKPDFLKKLLGGQNDAVDDRDRNDEDADLDNQSDNITKEDERPAIEVVGDVPEEELQKYLDDGDFEGKMNMKAFYFNKASDEDTRRVFRSRVLEGDTGENDNARPLRINEEGPLPKPDAKKDDDKKVMEDDGKKNDDDAQDDGRIVFRKPTKPTQKSSKDEEKKRKLDTQSSDNPSTSKKSKKSKSQSAQRALLSFGDEDGE